MRTDLYNKYKLFVDENGLKEKTIITFGKTIKEYWSDVVYNNHHYWVIKYRLEMEKDNETEE